jgi:hypothetical protein
MKPVTSRQLQHIPQEDSMDQSNEPHAYQDLEAASTAADPAAGKAPWQEPKLAFIEPTLTTHGTLDEVTAGYFGGFTP